MREKERERERERSEKIVKRDKNKTIKRERDKEAEGKRNIMGKNGIGREDRIDKGQE